MSKFFVFFALAFGFISVVSAAEKNSPLRGPASSGVCIKHPTIECQTGYEIKEIHGCFTCVHHSVDDNDIAEATSCIKKPTLICKSSYVAAQDANGCFHCAPFAIMEPTCIRHPTIECKHGYHVSEDHRGCFHCVKR